MARKTKEEQIVEIVAAVVESLITDIGSVGDIFDNAQKAGLLEAILSRLHELGIVLEQLFPKAVAEAYSTGLKFGEAALVTAGLTGGTLVATAPSKLIHVEALDALVSKGMGDLKAAIRTMEEEIPERLEQVLEDVQKDLGTTILTGENRKKATARVAHTFAKEGLYSFITADNKKLPLDFYAATVTKTKLRDAHNQGSVNRYIENGVDLVIVDKHFPTCKVCAQKQGIVISLSGKTKGYISAEEIGLPPFHPHCRHTIKPYILRGKTAEEIRKDKAVKYKPAKDTRTPAQKKAYETEQRIRKVANAEKKQYEAMKVRLGDKAPKTLAAFRRMKRKGNKQWIQLQKDYRDSIRISDTEREGG